MSFALFFDVFCVWIIINDDLKIMFQDALEVLTVLLQRNVENERTIR